MNEVFFWKIQKDPERGLESHLDIKVAKWHKPECIMNINRRQLERLTTSTNVESMISSYSVLRADQMIKHCLADDYLATYGTINTLRIYAHFSTRF